MISLKKNSAQSIVEYVLPLFFIMAISLGIWGSLSDNFKVCIANIFNTAPLTPPAQAQSTAQGQPSIQAQGTAGQPLTPIAENAPILLTQTGPNQPNYQDIAIPMADGSVLQLKNVPQDASKIIETVGVSGYSERLANTMIDLVEKLKAANTISESQYLSFKNMANLGLDMATKQKWVENEVAANPGVSWNTLQNKDISALIGYSANLGNILQYFNGQFSPKDVEQALATNTLEKLTAMGYQPLTNSFISQYASLKADGSLTNPAVKTVVDYLTASLLSGSANMSQTTYSITENTPINDLNKFYSEEYSIATKCNSINLCNAGNSQILGSTCVDKSP